MCASLLAEIIFRGCPVDRVGGGTVVEVYPAASLASWDLPYKGFKRAKNRPALGRLVGELSRTVPWLDFGAYGADCRVNHHDFDVVVAALTARGRGIGPTVAPTASEIIEANREGWIAVPNHPLAELMPTAI
jgi:hypothetical protein